jgi:hypothetical protein
VENFSTFSRKIVAFIFSFFGFIGAVPIQMGPPTSSEMFAGLILSCTAGNHRYHAQPHSVSPHKQQRRRTIGFPAEASAEEFQKKPNPATNKQ